MIEALGIISSIKLSRNPCNESLLPQITCCGWLQRADARSRWNLDSELGLDWFGNAESDRKKQVTTLRPIIHYQVDLISISMTWDKYSKDIVDGEPNHGTKEIKIYVDTCNHAINVQDINLPWYLSQSQRRGTVDNMALSLTRLQFVEPVVFSFQNMTMPLHDRSSLLFLSARTKVLS